MGKRGWSPGLLPGATCQLYFYQSYMGVLGEVSFERGVLLTFRTSTNGLETALRELVLTCFQTQLCICRPSY